MKLKTRCGPVLCS